MEKLKELFGIEVRVDFEDDRYPMLVLSGEHFTTGYYIDTDNGDLHRTCICFAHSSHECIYGAWDQ